LCRRDGVQSQDHDVARNKNEKDETSHSNDISWRTNRTRSRERLNPRLSS
jgi:hypothetical protein